MSDPRNVAHAKKVSQEKKHHPTAPEEAAPPATAAAVAVPETEHPAALEGSLVVLSKLKELEFHSRAHLERLAELSMTVEDELKQTAMVGPLGEVYTAQNTLQTKLTALIESYKDACDRMQGEPHR
jgi:hypothetical protein